MSAKLTKAQTLMLRMLASPSWHSGISQREVKNPGKIGMLRHLEERGLVDRGSIGLSIPKWRITPAGRAALSQTQESE